MSDILGFSLFQYHRERHDADGDPLTWPGGPTGLPVRGRHPGNLTREEWENMPVAFKVRVKTFDLKNDADIEEYREVSEKAANGLYLIRDREKVKDKETGEILKIFMEWAEPAHIAPTPNLEMPLPRGGKTYAANDQAGILAAMGGEPTIGERAATASIPVSNGLEQARRGAW